MDTITITYSFWGEHRWNQSTGELRVFSDIFTINDLPDVTSEILEECGGTVEQYNSVLGFVEKLFPVV